MDQVCPKCGKPMKSFNKSLSASVGPFTVKKFLPPELQEYNSVEFAICSECGYMELYWKR
ncbi:MAG: zinc ribbon domain-containing protein [Nitrososphaeria archaeon]|nr:zinc ribbon domain-containing protein [Aigarchaeota archaeon]MCX8187079.1 zinc ribbon domain-containing protein [Nitrososphaeria archaeon]MDW8021384.1 zinc ribbon domain-containing protein [Nitrososphaerota archaeon]